jgi:hypothetical protein
MAEPIDWDGLFAEYAAVRSAALSGLEPWKPFKLPMGAVRRATSPKSDDLCWMVEALGHEERKWFVAEIFRNSKSVPEGLFVSMLDAGIDEVNPSLNRSFIEPVVRAFGHRRVIEYLLDVVETDTDFRRAGSVNALYWAGISLTFPAATSSFDIENATPESRAAYEALSDLWERKRRLLLETFVSNPSVDVRRSIIPSLRLDATAYPESHRPLVEQAIKIARCSEDEYIRHRVEVQLGNVKLFAPLPHREKGGGPA